MKLFYSTASPYARTAQVTLREVGLEADSIEVVTHPFNNEPDFIAANPLAKVPCLVLENGTSLYDSEIICQYLDQTYNSKSLWFEIENDWLKRKRYSQVSGLLDLAVALRQEKMRQEEGLKSEFWWQRFERGLNGGLADLNSGLELGDFPKVFSLLHINTVCLLDYLSFRHPELNWQSFDALKEFYWQQANRQSFDQTQPRS